MTLRPLIVIFLFGVAACASSPPNRYYLLTPQATSTAAHQAPGTELTVSVSVPAYLDRPQMVFRDGNGEVDILEFDRWAEPVDGMIRRVLTQDIETRRTAGQPGLHVAVTIEDFTFDDDFATLKARWTRTPYNSRAQTKDTLLSHVFIRTAPVAADDIADSVAAMSNLVNQLAGAIAESR